MGESSPAAETADRAAELANTPTRPLPPPLPTPKPPALVPVSTAPPPAASTNSKINDAAPGAETSAEAEELGLLALVGMNAPSWLTSTVAHLSLVLLLALLTSAHEKFYGTPSDVEVSTVQGLDGEGAGIDDMMIKTQPLDVAEPPPVSALPDSGSAMQVADVLGSIGSDLPDVDLATNIGGGIISDGNGLGAGGGAGNGNSLEARLSGDSRATMVRRGGGTPQSEVAVERALHWLAEHQNYDGSWSFDHQKSPKCHGACRDPGYAPARIAATSLALLPFLGTGQTHQEGQYRKTIDLGLKFIVRSIGAGGSLHELGGQMYGHGLGAIVLCEAYGMTHDPTLRVSAQGVVDFIVAAQDHGGGGWRYVPGQPGDTSVVGWQMMALRSAKLAYLKVPPVTLQRAGYFLDSVQADKGATYGYTGPSARRPSTTAIGLLCRMYLGWKADQPALIRGVHILSQLGPSTDKTNVRNDMYYNYYATQVLHHFGGYPWEQWNHIMREYLIHTQAKNGHETGSWFFEGEDKGGPAGGRLYCTAMAAMTLEVYYRYMPLYTEQSTKGVPGRE